MARKTKEDAEATRESILDAAELCFLEEGVFRTTLERIAARAGCTRGAVYWHFKNKLEVLDMVMDRVELPLFSSLEKLAMASHAQPILALRMHCRLAFEEFTSNPHARNMIEIIVMRCELVEDTASILQRQQKSMKRGLDNASGAFRRAQQLGQLHEHLDPEACAMAIHYMMYGIIRQWLLNPQKMSPLREGMAALDAVMGSFLRGGLALATDEALPMGGDDLRG